MSTLIRGLTCLALHPNSRCYRPPRAFAARPRASQYPARSMASSAALGAKYCAHCGRLISPNHRHFDERKYCSKTCSGGRLTSTDRELEDLFMSLAQERGSIECTAVQQCYDHAHSDEPKSSNDNPQQAGMEAAKWRERVRRAGRRVIAHRSTSAAAFECVQQGKAVESSYAKGEWAVRLVKR